MIRRLALVAAAALAGLAAIAAMAWILSSPATDDGPRVWFTVGGYEVRNDDLWTVLTAICCSVACGLVGCFLVLRRMSLLGDAISHAILPGLAAAFLVTGSRAPVAMLVGALAVGILTALLSASLNRWGRVQEDAAMGVVFTTLFAIGVVLITWAARTVDLDPGCVLYGLIEFVPFDTVQIAGRQIPRSYVWLGAVLVANAALIAIFYKELKIVCFDPFLATTMGINATLVHYGLMTAVAGTAVASFEAVGSVLVVAMLVAPGATAQLLTDRLSRMLWIATLLAVAAAVVGYVLAVWWNTSVAGMIAVVSLAMFVTAVFVAPRHGVIAREVRRWILAAGICREDVLGLLYRWQEDVASTPRRGRDGHRSMTSAEIVEISRTGWLGRGVVRWLIATKAMRRADDGGVHLTSAGLGEARTLVRGHRLWEAYLVKRAGMDARRVHQAAHQAEHYLSEEIQSQLDRDLGERADPHGRAIPPPRSPD